MADREDELHLRPFPDEIRRLLDGTRSDVESLAIEAHTQWHQLHDRLIAIIAALIDDSVERGEALQALLDRVVARTAVGVGELVGAVPEAEAIAALLRTHHSTGTVTGDGSTVAFDHECGTGLALWRGNPELALVSADEVAGVPSGVPRYCARCIHTINGFGGGSWRVSPPASSAGSCHWEVDRFGSLQPDDAVQPDDAGHRDERTTA